MEVPTIISFSSLQRNVEQLVNIPVPRGGVRRLQGFPQNRVQQRYPVSKSLTFQFLLVKVFMGSSRDRVLRYLLSFQLVLQMTLFKGFFRTFPHRKKVRHDLRTLGRHCLRTRAHGHRQLMTCLWAVRRSRRRDGRCRRRRRWRSCSLSRSRSGRRRSRPGFESSLAPLPSRGGERGRRGRRRLLKLLPLVAALVVDSGSGVFLIFLMTFFFALCFLRSLTGLRCPASWPVWTRRTVAVAFTRLVFMVIMHLALCSPWLAGPVCSAFWPVWTRGTVAVACTRLVSLVIVHLALFLPFVRPMMLRIMAGLHQENSCPRRTGNFGLFGDDVLFIYGPLYLEVTCSSCLPEEYRVASFPGDDSRNGFCMQHSLVRQWVHAWRQSTRPFVFHTAENCGVSAVAVY